MFRPPLRAWPAHVVSFRPVRFEGSVPQLADNIGEDSYEGAVDHRARVHSPLLCPRPHSLSRRARVRFHKRDIYATDPYPEN